MSPVHGLRHHDPRQHRQPTAFRAVPRAAGGAVAGRRAALRWRRDDDRTSGRDGLGRTGCRMERDRQLCREGAANCSPVRGRTARTFAAASDHGGSVRRRTRRPRYRHAIVVGNRPGVGNVRRRGQPFLVRACATHRPRKTLRRRHLRLSALGGLLVDAGKRSPEELAPLAARAEFPAEWRVVLLTTSDTGTRWHGHGEEEALAAAGATDHDSLRRLALSGLLPALAEADLAA